MGASDLKCRRVRQYQHLTPTIGGETKVNRNSPELRFVTLDASFTVPYAVRRYHAFRHPQFIIFTRLKGLIGKPRYELQSRIGLVQ